MRIDAHDDQSVDQAEPAQTVECLHMLRCRLVTVTSCWLIKRVEDGSPGAARLVDEDESVSLEQREVSWDPVRRDSDPVRKLALVERESVTSRRETAQHNVDETSLGTDLLVVQHAVGNGVTPLASARSGK